MPANTPNAFALPRRLHAGAPTSSHVPVRNLDRSIRLKILCESERRQPTEDEVLATYEWQVFDATNARHRDAAQAIAAQKVQEARESSGIQPEPTPAPRPTSVLSFADIVDHLEGEAARRNLDAQPDSRGIVKKHIVVPEKAAMLACRLMGGGEAPTADEIEKCLTTANCLRATAAGDIPLPE